MIVTATGVAAALSVLLALLLIALVDVYRRSRPTAPRTWRRGVSLACSVASVGLAILAAKLWLIRTYGGDVPIIDQWNGEGSNVYQPFVHGTLRWVDLLAPHNEHRIPVARLVQLGWLLLNGQWDGVVQMTANAILHTATAVALVLVLWRQLGHRHLELLCLLVLAAFALPIGWENTLAGFQISFYLVVLFFVVPLALIPDAQAGSAPWWIGIALLALSLVSLASGVLNVVAVALALLLRWPNEPSRRPTLAGGLIVCAATGVLAVALGTPKATFEAHGLVQFGRAFSAWMAWPLYGLPFLAWLPWAPFLFLLRRAVARRGRMSGAEVTAVALGSWVLLQGLAISYARGGLQVAPAARYADMLSLGVVANGVILLMLFGERDRHTRMTALSALAVAWMAYMGVGFVGLTRQAVMVEAPIRRAWNIAYVHHMKTFVATQDLAGLRQLPYPAELPYPSADLLASVVMDPLILERLPVSIREPLLLQPLQGETTFVRGGATPGTEDDPFRPAWGSYSSAGATAEGRYASVPMRCSNGGYLKIDVAGDLGQERLDLQMVGASGAARSLRPTGSPGGRWRQVYVHCPSEPFSLVASDAAADKWFAFRAPIEIGTLSLVARVVTRLWPGPLLASLALSGIAMRLSTSRPGNSPVEDHA